MSRQQAPLVKILDRLAAVAERTHSAGARVCEAEGCLQATQHCKPLCPEHVLDMPYAGGVSWGLAQLERDYARLRAGGEVTEAIAEDMLATVIDTISVGTLARYHSIAPADAKRVVQYLAKRQLVRFTATFDQHGKPRLFAVRIDGR